MNRRKWILSYGPAVVAVSNLLLSFLLFMMFIVCGDSFVPCTPNNFQQVVFVVLTLPISLLPRGIGTFGYVSFLINAIAWGLAAHALLRLLTRHFSGS